MKSEKDLTVTVLIVLGSWVLGLAIIAGAVFL
jgi:hypothetical protein